MLEAAPIFIMMLIIICLKYMRPRKAKVVQLQPRYSYQSWRKRVEAEVRFQREKHQNSLQNDAPHGKVLYINSKVLPFKKPRKK